MAAVSFEYIEEPDALQKKEHLSLYTSKFVIYIPFLRFADVSNNFEPCTFVNDIFHTAVDQQAKSMYLINERSKIFFLSKPSSWISVKCKMLWNKIWHVVKMTVMPTEWVSDWSATLLKKIQRCCSYWFVVVVCLFFFSREKKDSGHCCHFCGRKNFIASKSKEIILSDTRSRWFVNYSKCFHLKDAIYMIVRSFKKNNELFKTKEWRCEGKNSKATSWTVWNGTECNGMHKIQCLPH